MHVRVLGSRDAPVYLLAVLFGNCQSTTFSPRQTRCRFHGRRRRVRMYVCGRPDNRHAWEGGAAIAASFPSPRATLGRQLAGGSNRANELQTSANGIHLLPAASSPLNSGQGKKKTTWPTFARACMEVMCGIYREIPCFVEV